MEPRFEVRYYCTRKMIAEFMRKHGTGPRLPITILFVAVYLFLVFLVAVGGVSEDNIYYLVMLTLVGVIGFFMPQYVAWASVRNAKKQNDGITPETVVTFGEKIEMHEGMIHLTVEYRKIVRVVHLKNSYVLMMGRRNGVMLEPNSFTKGTFAEFKVFLREQYPDFIIPE